MARPKTVIAQIETNNDNDLGGSTAIKTTSAKLNAVTRNLVVRKSSKTCVNNPFDDSVASIIAIADKANTTVNAKISNTPFPARHHN